MTNDGKTGTTETSFSQVLGPERAVFTENVTLYVSAGNRKILNCIEYRILHRDRSRTCIGKAFQGAIDPTTFGSADNPLAC